jgi:hypothetical protein
MAIDIPAKLGGMNLIRISMATVSGLERASILVRIIRASIAMALHFCMMGWEGKKE